MIGGGGLCAGIINRPCVNVTICIPGSAQCQTVTDILLDTGSVGLRVFKSVLTLDFSQHLETNGQGNIIGECVIFGTGAVWGSVANADVILGDEPRVSIPIHLVDSTFAGQSAASNPCRQPVDATPQNAGFNGLLGIDGFESDRGAGIYFSCSTSACALLGRPANAVLNPVAVLPNDNNGHVITFPAVDRTGAPTVTGSLLLGIGTRSNNMPSGVSVLTRDAATGTIMTVYKGTAFPGFFDTGSTFLFFSDPAIPECANISGAFCPSSPVNLTATNQGRNQASSVVNFQIANANDLGNSGNGVFDNLGGPDVNMSAEFDWGLPFFLGRTVYTGMAGRGSSLGTGPFWAY